MYHYHNSVLACRTDRQDAQLINILYRSGRFDTSLLSAGVQLSVAQDRPGNKARIR
jgi:hypothetical protein